jgi:hypothetical protein
MANTPKPMRKQAKAAMTLTRKADVAVGKSRATTGAKSAAALKKAADAGGKGAAIVNKMSPKALAYGKRLDAKYDKSGGMAKNLAKGAKKAK